MKSIARLSLIGLLSIAATGCVYVNGERVSSDDWRHEQTVNREAISRLDMGMSRASVVNELGTPDDSEAFELDGQEVRVLFYRTQHRNSDGETTRDETTPLVFENDALVGWGQTVYDKLR